MKSNGEPMRFEGGSKPFSLHVVITRIPEKLRYDELFVSMHEAIKVSKSN